MPIINIKDNKNNRWKRNKTKQTNKQTKTIRISLINYFKEKITIWVKACCDGVYMFKKMRLVILFHMFLKPSFKMTTSLPNKAGTSASNSKFIY